MNNFPSTSRQWIYQRRPEGLIGAEHYSMVKTPLPALSTGDILIEARYFSVDPYMRINQAKGVTWMPPHPLGAVQSGSVVGRVLASRAEGFTAGDWVSAYSGWQTHAVLQANALEKIDVDGAPHTTALGVLGMPGRTAWFGLTEAGRPKPGETVVVSAAAGAVGSLVVQFAKRHGARVVGIAGGPDKCAWVVDALGADAALDYRAYSNCETLGQAIRDQFGGVDVYFDNVGGWITDAIIPLVNQRARIVICGQISQYSDGLDTPAFGPRLLHHLLYQRATIQGVLARDYVHRMDEMKRIVRPWVLSGDIVFEETIIHGFESLPATLNSLFTGSHRGKLIVSA